MTPEELAKESTEMDFKERNLSSKTAKYPEKVRVIASFEPPSNRYFSRLPAIIVAPDGE